jgi:hypothetical protein
MITPEERQEIINEAVDKAVEKALLLFEKAIEKAIDKATEKIFLLIPETIGNLIVDHVTMNKINAEFYKNHPEFKDHKDVVMSVIEATEGKNPTINYKDLLGKAVPKIQERIKTMESLDMKTVSPTPSRTYEPLSVPKIDSQHGEL